MRDGCTSHYGSKKGGAYGQPTGSGKVSGRKKRLILCAQESSLDKKYNTQVQESKEILKIS